MTMEPQMIVIQGCEHLIAEREALVTAKLQALEWLDRIEERLSEIKTALEAMQQ